MCGLVGAFGKLETKHQVCFSMLLYLDYFRGTDSTGIYFEDKKGNGKVLKTLSTPSDMIWDFPKEMVWVGVWPTVDCDDNVLLLGHNRAATQGKITAENAHPFEFDNIVGAHNGTMRSFTVGTPYYDVDSQRLFHLIDDLGKKKSQYHTFEEIIQSVSGAKALTWWNKKEKELHIYRNAERPLFVSLTADRNVMFWASEKWMLEVASKKARINISSIEEVATHTHYVFELKKDGKPTLKSDKNINPWKSYPKTTTHTVTTKTVSQVKKNPNGWPVREATKVIEQHKNDEKNPETFVIFNETWNEDKFRDKTRCGCTWCGSGLQWKDRLTLIWWDKETPFCESCQTDGSAFYYCSEHNMTRGQNAH